MRLSARCLKKDEALEACHSPGCQNLIHLICFKKVMSAFAENYWEGLLFCGKRCFNNKKKVLEAASIKHKGSQIIKDRGIALERLGQDIHVKINCLEQQFHAATDQVNQKGDGETCKESIRAAVKQRCPYYYELVEVMSDRASTTSLSTKSSINRPEVIDCEVRGMGDDNKPIAVDIPNIKRTAEDVPIVKKKTQSSPSSFSSDLTELSQLRESR